MHGNFVGISGCLQRDMIAAYLFHPLHVGFPVFVFGSTCTVLARSTMAAALFCVAVLVTVEQLSANARNWQLPSASICFSKNTCGFGAGARETQKLQSAVDADVSAG